MSSIGNVPIKVLYFTRDSYPTFRVDISVLFGRFLYKKGFDTTIVADRNNTDPEFHDSHLKTILHNVRNDNRYLHALKSIIADIYTLLINGNKFHIIQVRNKIILASIAIVFARYYGLKFCYWMSFPYPDDDILRVKQHGRRLGFIRSAATLSRGFITKILLYKFVLPFSHHVFVQSKKMEQDVAIRSSIVAERMSVVPMAVDTSSLSNWKKLPVKLPVGRSIAYLGAMDRARRIDFLFMALKHVRKSYPNTNLILIGDCIEAEDWKWLKTRAEMLGVDHAIVKTGWVDRDTAWSYVSSADVGVCALPNKFIFNSMSPTKAVEMLSLGLPTVVTQHPDQGALIRESGGGIVTEYEPIQFGEAVNQLLESEEKRTEMGRKGHHYIMKYRCYSKISDRVAQIYRLMFDLK